MKSRPDRYLVLGLLVCGGLSGCKFDEDRAAAYKESKAYRAVHPVDIDTLPSVTTHLSDQPNVVTGRIAPHATPSVGIALPAPEPIDSELETDETLRTLTAGERVGGWTGVADIYWKLNWMRSELLAANVPRNLHQYIVRTRKHAERIAHEYPGQTGIDKYLDVANKALQHLDTGWDHFQQSNALEAANIHSRSIPWGTGEEQVKTYFVNQGLAVSERADSHSAYVEHDDDGDGHIAVRRSSAALPISPQQQQAVDLALRYERMYHGSPDSVARQEFSEGMRETLRLGELLQYTYRPPSVPGTMTTIVTPLRQEASSSTPLKPPVSPTNAPLPDSTTKAEASDPFHASGPIIR